MSAIKFYSRGTRGEIWLYGPVGDSWGEGMSAKQFATELSALGSVNTINIRINSEGGSVFDGMAIYNQLDRHQAQIEVDVDGLAASIASVIAMAGDTISIAENAMMMIHDPWTAAFGDSSDLRKTADLLDTIKGQIANTYSKRTGMALDQVAALMSEETWMDSKTAHKAGFVDRVSGELAIAACADLSRFRHVPKKLLASATSAEHALALARVATINQRMRVRRANAA